MKVVIIGCGRVGAELAARMESRGHHVSVVDEQAASFTNLPPQFQGRMVEGEALNQDVLERAGIQQADAFAAVTDADSINAVVGHIAREVYHVPQVVVRNHDPRWLPIHQAFGLQVVSPTSWGAQRVEDLLYHGGMRSVFSAGNGEVEIYEVVVPAAWNGKRVSDLMPQGLCVAATITRSGRAILPECDAVLETGDVLGISATLEGIETLLARLKSA